MNAPHPELATLRLPPHSIDAEQSLIGALILSPRVWDAISDVVTDADFYRDDHRRIFRHIARLCDSGKTADVVTVFDSITRANEVDQTGGLAYLGEIAANTASAANARQHALIVADRSRLRKLLCYADEIAALAMSAGVPSEQAIDAAETKLLDIAEERIAGDEPVSINALLGATIDQMQQEYDRESTVSGTPYGFADLDAKTGGMMPGDMIVIAGRPSMGKTALALHIVENVAVGLRKPVLVFSLEMTGAQLAKRTLAGVGSINGARLRSPKSMDDSDWDRMTVALGKLADAPIYIDDSGSATMTKIRAKARRLSRKVGGLGLVVIDYLQLIDASNRGDNRNTEVTEISRAIKALAKELHSPVIALSQLSRKVEERPKKRPQMSDLRESGAIEQDADQIHLLYRDDYYHPDSMEKNIVEVNVAKHRDGEVGQVDLLFRKEFSRFGDVDAAELAMMRASRKTSPSPSRQFKD